MDRTVVNRYHNLHITRRLTQITFALLLFLAPSLNILRYDSASKELIVFGSVWSLGIKELIADHSLSGASEVALIILFKAILPWLLILSIFPLLGIFAGRFFCGWLCPEGAMFEFVDFLSLKLLGRRSLYGRKPNDPEVKKTNRLLYGIVAVISFIVLLPIAGIALTGYFIAPETIWHQIVNGNLSFGVTAGIIGVSIYMLITSIFVRHLFCRYVCAAGLMQMLFGWVSPISLRLKMDASRISECTDCKGCERACFMNVLPRKNKKDISCVNCGACIVACDRELGKGKGLFHYRIGDERCLAPSENCRNLHPHTVKD